VATPNLPSLDIVTSSTPLIETDNQDSSAVNDKVEVAGGGGGGGGGGGRQTGSRAAGTADRAESSPSISLRFGLN
jgi:hypothetical protein